MNWQVFRDPGSRRPGGPAGGENEPETRHTRYLPEKRNHPTREIPDAVLFSVMRTSVIQLTNYLSDDLQFS
jgi:hypothetical protein